MEHGRDGSFTAQAIVLHDSHCSLILYIGSVPVSIVTSSVEGKQA